jgi:hypothetical protein
MGQIFSTLFYLVIGYVVGLLLAPAGLFSLTIAATQWDTSSPGSIYCFGPSC